MVWRLEPFYLTLLKRNKKVHLRGNIKVSYVCSDENINVFSSSGRVIYTHPNRRKRSVIFNLPNGIFNTKNNILYVKKKKNFVPSFQMLFKEYPAQWNWALPKIGELTNNFVISNNPNKASIYPGLHKIIADKKLFENLPRPCVKFILFHELGHYFYKEESYCDLFAVVCMLQNGFNYYDCMLTQTKYLNRSAETVKRTLFVYKKLIYYGTK